MLFACLELWPRGFPGPAESPRYLRPLSGQRCLGAAPGLPHSRTGVASQTIPALKCATNLGQSRFLPAAAAAANAIFRAERRQLPRRPARIPIVPHNCGATNTNLARPVGLLSVRDWRITPVAIAAARKTDLAPQPRPPAAARLRGLSDYRRPI